MDKRSAMQLLSIGIIRFLFIVSISLAVTVISGHRDQKIIRHRRVQKVNLGAKTVYSPPPVSGKKAEHLLHPIIVRTARRYQVDPAIIKAIIMAESGYNPKAISKKGAKGLMQLMPETALELGVNDIFNPQQNIDGGVRYFKRLVNRFDGDFKLALAAYNAGSRNVRIYQGIPPFKATQYYIKKVYKYYRLYKNQISGEMDSA